jgi:hypothetical protein
LRLMVQERALKMVARDVALWFCFPIQIVALHKRAHHLSDAAPHRTRALLDEHVGLTGRRPQRPTHPIVIVRGARQRLALTLCALD